MIIDKVEPLIIVHLNISVTKPCVRASSTRRDIIVVLSEETENVTNEYYKINIYTDME